MHKIEPLMHRCTVQSGPMEGNKHWVAVTAWDVRMGAECMKCGETLATMEQLTLHMYEQLTESE